MPTTSLDNSELVPIVERILEILKEHPPVLQQQVIEVLATQHAFRMGSLSRTVVNGMNKHINQMLDQLEPLRGKPQERRYR